MLQLNNTCLINNVNEFLGFFVSKASGDSDTGWRMHEGSDGRDGLSRGGICHLDAIVG